MAIEKSYQVHMDNKLILKKLIRIRVGIQAGSHAGDGHRLFGMCSSEN